MGVRLYRVVSRGLGCLAKPGWWSGDHWSDQESYCAPNSNMCSCSLVGGQDECSVMPNSESDRHCYQDLGQMFATVGRERENKGSVAVTRGKVPRDRVGAGGWRAGGLKREEKNREKLVRATTAGRQRREGIFVGRKEEPRVGREGEWKWAYGS